MDGLYQRLVLRRPPPEGADLDMSIQDVRVFVLLAHSAPMTMSAFAGTLGVPLSTATNSIERLVKKGLVVRQHSERDRRVVQVELSPEGRKHEECFFARRLAMGRDMLAPLSSGEREIFLELMDKMARLATGKNEAVEEK